MASKGGHKRTDAAAVLDIGSHKVVCLIGQQEPNMGVRLIGSGFGVSAGIKGGVVVDMDAAEAGIRTCLLYTSPSPRD